MDDYIPDEWKQSSLTQALGAGDVAAAIDIASSMEDQLTFGQFLIQPVNPRAANESSLLSLISTLEHTPPMETAINVVTLATGLRQLDLTQIPIPVQIIIRDALASMLNPEGTPEDEWSVSEAEVHAVSSGLSPVYDLETEREAFEDYVEHLNNPEYLQEHPSDNQYHEEALYIAVSYRHADETGANKMTQLAKHDLVAIILSLSAKSRRNKVCFWHDRILSAKSLKTNQKWYQSGLLPYTTFVTIFVSKETRSDAELIDDQDRMWVNIERVAASRAKGTYSYGRRVDLTNLGRAGISIENTDIGTIDRWQRENMKRDSHEAFKALLFDFGNTTILSRDTYFPADRDELLTLSMKTFLKVEDVFCLRVGSNFARRDDVKRRTRKQNYWAGAQEWLANFEIQDAGSSAWNAQGNALESRAASSASRQTNIEPAAEASDDQRRARRRSRGHRLKDCIDSAVASVGRDHQLFSYRLVADSGGVRRTWCLAVIEDDRPTVTLAIEIGDEEEVKTSGTVVLDDPRLFVEMVTEGHDMRFPAQARDFEACIITKMLQTTGLIGREDVIKGIWLERTTSEWMMHRR